MTKDAKTPGVSIVTISVASLVIILFLSLASVALASVIYPDWFEGLRLSLASKVAQTDVNQAVADAKELSSAQSDLAGAIERLESQTALIKQSQSQIQEQRNQIERLESKIEELNSLLKVAKPNPLDQPDSETQSKNDTKEEVLYSFANVHSSISKVLSSGIKEITEQKTTLDKNRTIVEEKDKLLEICKQFDNQQIRIEYTVEDKESFNKDLILLSVNPKKNSYADDKAIKIPSIVKIPIDVERGERIRYRDSVWIEATIFISFDTDKVERTSAATIPMFLVNARTYDSIWTYNPNPIYGHLFELKNAKVLD